MSEISTDAVSFLAQFGLPAMLALLGACWGSFAATVTERWPQGRSIVHPGSQCDGCKRALQVRDLVPVVSYAIARGRCRYCAAPISSRYPLIETTCAGIGLVSGCFLPAPESVWMALFGWQLLLLAILDAEHFWLPDPLIALLTGSGLCIAALGGTKSLISALLGAVVGFASLAGIALLYKRVRRRTGMGGGDPKLLGAIGIWVGWQALPMILLFGAGLGLCLALFVAASDTRRIAVWQRKLPLGTCLAFSAWVWCLLDKIGLSASTLY